MVDLTYLTYRRYIYLAIGSSLISPHFSAVLSMLVIECFHFRVGNMISGTTHLSHSNSSSPQFFPLCHLFAYLSAELCITSTRPAAKHPAPPGLSTTYLAFLPEGITEGQY